MGVQENFREQVRNVYRLLMLVLVISVLTGAGLIYFTINPDFLESKKVTETLIEVPLEVDEDLIENGIHVRTGLVEADGLMEVVNNCTACHSAKIVTQNRMNAERWNATIKWMQETQNLWDLGGNQEIIVNYLVTNYPPIAKGRRLVLTDIEWYELEE